MASLNSGIIIPKISLSSLDSAQLTSQEYFLGFDLDNNGKLSKLDQAGTITEISSEDIITTSVTVTGAELIAASTPGDVVKTLIASPGANKFIEVESMIIKFKDATVAFDNGPSYGLTEFRGTFTVGLFGLGTTDDIIGHATGVIAEINQSLDFVLNFGTAPTVGDGNLIFDIRYRILDF